MASEFPKASAAVAFGRPNQPDIAQRAPNARALTVVLAALLTGAFLAPLDFFAVNLALPAIRADLRASPAQLQLVIAAYGCAFGVLLVTGGRLGDRFGRKRMYMAGLASFMLSSALCACAGSGGALIAFRVAQGISAAVAVPQIIATIRTVFPTDWQTRAIALYGFVIGVSSVVGQLAGGWLVTERPFGFGWQMIFLLNLPIGGAALIGVWLRLQENRAPKAFRIDLVGAALLSLALFLLVFPLSVGRENGWPLWSWLTLAASAPLFIVFLLFERRKETAGGSPLVELNLFRNKVFSTGLILAFLFYLDSGFFLTYGVFLQIGLQWSGLACGVATLPFGFGAILGSWQSPTLVRKFGVNALAPGFACLALGFLLAALALLLGSAPHPAFYVALFVAGAGHGAVLPSIAGLVVREIEPAKAGLATGLVTSVLQIGSAFGATLLGGLFLWRLPLVADPLDYASAFQLVLYALGGLSAFCTWPASRMSLLRRGA
jgi:EmrB/QacA subfamily drug resistance transporter